MRGCRAAAHAKGFQLSVAIVLLLLSACALSPASGYGADSNVDGYGGKDDISEGMKTGADDSAVGYVFRFCDSCGYMTFTDSSSNDAIFWGCWLVWERGRESKEIAVIESLHIQAWTRKEDDDGDGLQDSLLVADRKEFDTSTYGEGGSGTDGYLPHTCFHFAITMAVRLKREREGGEL